MCLNVAVTVSCTVEPIIPVIAKIVSYKSGNFPEYSYGLIHCKYTSNDSTGNAAGCLHPKIPTQNPPEWRATRPKPGIEYSEYNDGRCRVWTRAKGIEGTVPLANYVP